MKYTMLAAVLPLMLPLAAAAQTTPTNPSGTPATTGVTTAKLSVQDAHFIKMAAIAGMGEVNDGQLASTMGATAAVKQIGTRMVTDHTKANDQLTAIAQQKAVTPPADVGAKQAAQTAKLKGLSGAAFDKYYLQTELAGHYKTIALFKAEASTGSDPDLKAFASATMPTLQQHLSMIKMAMAK